MRVHAAQTHRVRHQLSVPNVPGIRGSRRGPTKVNRGCVDLSNNTGMNENKFRVGENEAIKNYTTKID